MSEEQRINDGFERLATVESEIVGINARIKDVVSSNKTLWSRVRDDEQRYMGAVPKAHSAHDGMIKMGAILDNLTNSLLALHKRNDEKDISDAVAYGKLEAKIDSLSARANAKDITDAELRGARRLKGKILAWVSTVIFGLLVSFFVWIVVSIHELDKKQTIDIPKIDKAIKKEDQTIIRESEQ